MSVNSTGTDWRATVRGDLDRLYPMAVKKLEKAVDSKRKTWGHCVTCKKSVQVDVPDTKALVEALKFLAEQGHGKPREMLEVQVQVDFDRDLERWQGYLREMTIEEKRVMAGYLRRRLAADARQAALPPGSGPEAA